MGYKEIPFGLKDGRFVTVQDIPSDVHGIDCDCICPCCHKPLVIIRAKDKRTHFRHKASEMHCHYNYDEQTLEYVWDLLEKSGLAKDVNLDDLKYFKIDSLNHQQTNHTTHNKNSHYIEEIDKDHHLMKIVINDETFKIKLGIHSQKEDPSTIYINLKDFNTETLFNSQQNELIKSLINKISEKINDQQNKIHQEKISREFLKNQISQITQATTKQPIKQNEWDLGEIVKILPKKCPKCGANMCKRKGKNGNVIVCSSYPECDMTAQKLMSGIW